MGDNLKIRKLRVDLTQTLNSSTLPLEVKRMIVEELLNALNKLVDEAIEKEIAEQEKETNEEKESEQ